jgi:hypothetical protein
MALPGFWFLQRVVPLGRRDVPEPQGPGGAG